MTYEERHMSLRDISEKRMQMLFNDAKPITVVVHPEDWEALKYKLAQLNAKNKGLFLGSNWDTLVELFNFTIFLVKARKKPMVRKFGSLLSNYSTQMKVELVEGWRFDDDQPRLRLERK